MADTETTDSKTQKAKALPKLPPQKNAQDTSNWVGREFTTPTGRVVIETREDADKDTVVAE